MLWAVLALSAGSAHAAAPSRPSAVGAWTAAEWRAAAQSAPAREVLALLGQQGVPDALALPDGGTVVAGSVSRTGSLAGARLTLARLLPDGSLDRSFGADGVELTPIELLPWRILGLPDGKLLILGPGRSPGAEVPRITRFPDWEILRLLPDGSPDPSFGRGGLLDVAGVPVGSEGPAAGALPELEPDGGVLLPTVIGPVLTPAARSGLVRLSADGSRYGAFGSSGLLALPANLLAFSVATDGSVTVAMIAPGGVELTRLLSGGSPDPGFNGGAPAQTQIAGIASMLVQPGGAVELYSFPPSKEFLADRRVYRYTAAGTPDASWGSGGSIDVGKEPGFLTQLLPAPGGQTVIVNMGIAPATGFGFYRVQIRRLTAAGQFDPTLGGAAGLLQALPFGGDTYAPGAIADLRANSFTPTGVIERADGTLLFTGMVRAEEAYETMAGPAPVAWFGGFALAALNSSYRLDGRFDGFRTPALSARVTSTRLRSNGVAVQLSYADAALAVVTIRHGSTTIAKGTVRFFSKERVLPRRSARIPLTAAGRRLLSAWRVHVTLSASLADLAANHARASASATLGR